MSPRFLDDPAPLEASVGWGVAVAGGRLGVEGKNVVVGGRRYENALGTHPPERVARTLGGDETESRCAVALNDDAAGSAAEANFATLARLGDAAAIDDLRGSFRGLALVGNRRRA